MFLFFFAREKGLEGAGAVITRRGKFQQCGKLLINIDGLSISIVQLWSIQS